MLWNMGTDYTVVVKIRPDSVRPQSFYLASADAFDKGRYARLDHVAIRWLS